MKEVTPEQLYLPYLLKGIKRHGTVDGRRESTAEHIYSSMTLASYYLRFYPELDANRVYKLLLYHDLDEIYADNTFIFDKEMELSKEEREEKAFAKLLSDFPSEIAGEIKSLWPEYKTGSTKEARFTQAIQKLDPMFHSIHMPQEWQRYNFTEKKLRAKKEKYFEEFPRIHDMFNKVIKKLLDSGAITKK